MGERERECERDREDINMKEEEENRGQRINNTMQNAQERGEKDSTREMVWHGVSDKENVVVSENL